LFLFKKNSVRVTLHYLPPDEPIWVKQAIEAFSYINYISLMLCCGT